jgi:hypothetical protein
VVHHNHPRTAAVIKPLAHREAGVAVELGDEILDGRCLNRHGELEVVPK